jgi:DNA polymerase I-like protein with 3'-5' exonuclease and polymerase domains
MKLYGAKFVENMIQALAFMLITDVDLRVKKLTKGAVELALQVHDELIYVVPERVAEDLKKVVIEEMSRRPSWLPTLPLAAEGHIGRSYGDAK